jgi:hypothetical protein
LKSKSKSKPLPPELAAEEAPGEVGKLPEWAAVSDLFGDEEVPTAALSLLEPALPRLSSGGGRGDSATLFTEASPKQGKGVLPHTAPSDLFGESAPAPAGKNLLYRGLPKASRGGGHATDVFQEGGARPTGPGASLFTEDAFAPPKKVGKQLTVARKDEDAAAPKQKKDIFEDDEDLLTRPKSQKKPVEQNDDFF